MLKYILKRIGIMFFTLIVLTTLLFAMLHSMPGSPFNDPKITETQKKALEKEYHLDKPVIVQYGYYMKNLAKGDLGESIKRKNQNVSDIIKAPLYYTTILVILTTLVGTIIGLFLGILAALYKDKWIDNLCSVIGVAGVSLPSFVVAIMILLFLNKYPIIPTALKISTDTNGVGKIEEIFSLTAPVIALSFFFISSMMRYMRSELVEVLESDYILLARSKGLNKKEVVIKHGIRNALIPVITVIGPLIVSLLGGSTFAEYFFGVPGLSVQLIQSINNLDYFLILGISLFYAILYMGVMLIIDVLYGVIDPRIRLSGGKVHE